MDEDVVNRIRALVTPPAKSKRVESSTTDVEFFDVEYRLDILPGLHEAKITLGGVFSPLTFFLEGRGAEGAVLEGITWGGFTFANILFPVRDIDQVFSVQRRDGSTNRESPLAPLPGNRASLFFGQDARFIFRAEKAYRLVVRGLLVPYKTPASGPEKGAS